MTVTKREILKIFFLAFIAGSIMGVVIIEIFGTLTMMGLVRLEICVIFIIIFLFAISKWWNKRLNKNIEKRRSLEKKD
ncbi:hypothetical protein [Candidatus Nitrosocosmicus hydrocola]|uniref:hypothetical protein n=1 Tax=Candidatus Nitrosocosmicus hydrocola TaxID=1826872 RepID=UPI0013725C2F|nr:hypothetical protein [Candidatus Nitrosocosmicus hydrocola]